MSLNYLASLGHYVPELLACLTMIGLILTESTYSNREKNKAIYYSMAYIGLGFVLISLGMAIHHKPISIFTNSLVIDPFSSFIKIIMTIGTIGAIYLSEQSSDIDDRVKGEFAILATGVLVGGMLLASANNMLTLYLGIETLSILSYVLASLKKGDEKSSESGLKYSLYGGISAGFMLFGMSHIFGVTGTIQFSELARTLQSVGTDQTVILLPAFLLFFVGIGYKIASVPFHMWSPDVYEGSPLPVTTFFSIVPKFAGMAALIRVSLLFFGNDNLLSHGWVGTLSVIAALTMTVGNVSAIGQRSIKRMLAYSSISHAGVMMLGVVVMSDIGVKAILFYGVTYLFMTLVAFYVVNFVQNQYGNDHFERFNGLVFRYPLMAIMMAVTMFSLAGIPPLSGFVAKFNIFSAILAKKYYVLALIAGVNSVISLYYYLKIVRFMVFKPVESEEAIVGFGFANQTLIVALTVPVILLGIFWSNIIHIAGTARIFLQ